MFTVSLILRMGAVNSILCEYSVYSVHSECSVNIEIQNPKIHIWKKSSVIAPFFTWGNRGPDRERDLPSSSSNTFPQKGRGWQGQQECTQLDSVGGSWTNMDPSPSSDQVGGSYTPVHRLRGERDQLQSGACHLWSACSCTHVWWSKDNSVVWYQPLVQFTLQLRLAHWGKSKSSIETQSQALRHQSCFKARQRLLSHS